jgi:integrase
MTTDARTAACSGLRRGELAALAIPQVDQDARVITVDRKVTEVAEVAGHLYIEAPKGRKSRRTIYPRNTQSATRLPNASPPA